MKKADYSKIAASFDQGRPLSEQIIDLWLDVITRMAKAPRGARLLDIGCGTGRFSIPLSEKCGYKVTGADNSPEMLDKAREKDPQIKVAWEVQDAQNLTFDDETFDVVFMSHLLHHCDDPDKTIRECYRVLKKPGTLLVRHGAWEQIEDDVEHTFFPETIEIDKARIFTFKKMADCIKKAGFKEVLSETVTQRGYETGYDILRADSLKGNSVLTLISAEAFEKGITKLKAYVEKHPNDPWLLHASMTLTAGYKK